jgi:hypothetical protein
LPLTLPSAATVIVRSGPVIAILSGLPAVPVVTGPVIAILSCFPTVPIIPGTVIAILSGLPAVTVVTGSVIAILPCFPAVPIISGTVITILPCFPTIPIIPGAVITIFSGLPAVPVEFTAIPVNLFAILINLTVQGLKFSLCGLGPDCVSVFHFLLDFSLQISTLAQVLTQFLAILIQPAAVLVYFLTAVSYLIPSSTLVRSGGRTLLPHIALLLLDLRSPCRAGVSLLPIGAASREQQQAKRHGDHLHTFSSAR